MGRLQILLSMNTCSDKKSRKQVWSKSVTNNGLLSSFVAAINYKRFSLRCCSKTLNSCFCVSQANSLTKFVFQSPKIFVGRTSYVIQFICHHRNGFLRLSQHYDLLFQLYLLSLCPSFFSISNNLSFLPRML